MARLGAQPPHVAGRVVAGERGEIDQRDRAQQPRRLPLLLDRAPRRDRRRAPLDGAAVHADGADDVEVQRNPWVPRRMMIRGPGALEQRFPTVVSCDFDDGLLARRLGRGFAQRLVVLLTLCRRRGAHQARPRLRRDRRGILLARRRRDRLNEPLQGHDDHHGTAGEKPA